MEEAEPTDGRRPHSNERLPPPPVGIPLALASLAALLGAAAWGLLAIYADLQHGFLAWGIGGLVGFAVVKGGGYGKQQAILAAVLAVLAIGVGRYIIYKKVCWDYTAVTLAEGDQHIDTWQKEAEAWRALGDNATDEQVEAFAIKNDYDVEDAADFRTNHAPRLESFFSDKPTRTADLSEDERDILRMRMLSMMSDTFPFTAYLQRDFHLVDILFAALGLATAFGIVQRRTDELRAAAREALRAERASDDDGQ